MAVDSGIVKSTCGSNCAVDSGLALLRVHLSGDHELPVLVLCAGIGAGYHSHIRGSCARAVYLVHCLVSTNDTFNGAATY